MADSDSYENILGVDALTSSDNFSFDSSGNTNVHDNRIINVGDPTSGTDATNKNYVDKNATPYTGGTPIRQPNLQDWYDDLYTADTQIVDLVCIGDSIMTLTAWPNTIAEHLNTKYASRLTTQISPQVGIKYPDPAGSSVRKMDSTTGSAPAQFSTLADWGATLTDGETAEHTASCDGVLIVWSAGTGTLTVKDGGSGGSTVATIDTSTGTTTGNITSVDLTSYASHQVYIVSSGTSVLEAVYFTVGNRTSAGVRVWDLSHSGYTTEHYTTNLQMVLNFIEKLATHSGRQPHVVIGTGYNDSITTNYQTRLEALVDAVQARTTGSVAIWIPYTGSANNTTANSSVGRSVASAKGCGVIDTVRSIGDVSSYSDPFSYSTDGVHIGGSGAATTAVQANMVLSGDPLGVLSSMVGTNYGFTYRTVGGYQLITAAGLVQYAITSLLGNPIINIYDTAGDTQPSVGITTKSIIAALTGLTGGGGLAFGAGASSAVDTFLFRSAASILYTTGQMTHHRQQNAQTGTSYTLVLGDNGKIVTCSNASAITLTIPPNSSVAFPTGTEIHIWQIGAGQVTVTPGSGVTLRARLGAKTGGQYAMTRIVKQATNTWYMTGDCTT